MHGTTLPAGDPAWDAIYPPNGFNCRCRVRAITDRQAGSEVGSGAVEDFEDVDGGTGEIIRRRRATWTGPDGQARSFAPDPGWGHAPGALRAPSQSATVAVGQRSWRDRGLPDARDLPRAPAPPELPAAPSRHDAAVALEGVLGLSDHRPSRRVATPVDEVLLTQQWALHVTEKRDQARERYANRILPTLEDPDEVWMTLYDTPRGPEYRMSYVKAFDDFRSALSIVTELQDGSVLYNFMPVRSRGLNGRRVGTLLYQRAN